MQCNYLKYNYLIFRTPLFYFGQHKDNRKLARAFYYKGELLLNKGMQKESVISYKQAEYAVPKDELWLKHHIYESLAYVNQKGHNYALSQQYITESLHLAKKLNKPDWEAYDHQMMSLNYDALGKQDSAKIHTKQVINLLPKMTETGKKYILESLFTYYQCKDPQFLESLMHTALQQKNNNTAILNMSALRYNQGRKAEAYELLDKINAKAWGQNYEAMLQTKRNMNMADGNYLAANNLSMQIIALKDSLQLVKENKNLQAVQHEFDRKVQEEKRYRLLSYAITGIVFVVMFIISAALYYKYRTLQLHKLLDQDRRQITQLTEQMDIARKSMDADGANRDELEKKIKTLQQQVVGIEERHNGLLTLGRRRYLDIQDGKSTVTWDKNDFTAFAEYYKIIDIGLMHCLEEDYDSLTDKNKALIIFENMGLTNDHIAMIMGVSQGAIRTARSRIEKKHA